MLVKVPVRAMQATSLLPSIMFDVHVPCSHVGHCLVPHLELAVAMSKLPSLCEHGMELQLAHYWLHRGTHQLEEDPSNLRLLICEPRTSTLASQRWRADGVGCFRVVAIANTKFCAGVVRRIEAVAGSHLAAPFLLQPVLPTACITSNRPPQAPGPP